MNTDIRLLLSFPSHPKVKKLRLKLGAEGPLGFIYLLIFAAQSRPDGKLTNMDADDIALAADYRGDPDEFRDVLTQLRLLDVTGDLYSIHDWERNNPWASGAQGRSEQAAKAARARWKKERGRDIDAETKNQQVKPKKHAHSTDQQCGEHASAMRGVQNSNAPYPYPYPNPAVADLSYTDTLQDSGQVGAGEKATSAAASAVSSEKEKKTTTWRPLGATLANLKQICTGITDEFLEIAAAEFRIYAEQNGYQPRTFESRFFDSALNRWKRQQSKPPSNGTGATPDAPRKPAGVDLRALPDDQLAAWSAERGGPEPKAGENPDDYRLRIVRALRRKNPSGAGQVPVEIAAAAEAMTIDSGDGGAG